MSSLDDFFGRMGQALLPATDAPAPGSYGLGQAATGYKTVDATVAAHEATVRYVELSTRGEALRQMMIAGVKIPCTIWMAYAQARQDYLAKSQEIWNQLAARGISIHQVIYSAGKPSVDTAGNVRTVVVNAPLRPPAFLGIDKDCPGVPMMSGATAGWSPIPVLSFGAVPLITAAAAAACTAATVGACLILVAATGLVIGLVSYAAYKISQQVAISVREYESSPAKIVAAYTACFEGQVKAGMATKDASAKCSAAQASAQQYAKDRGAQDSGLGMWGWLGVGVGVLVAGTLLFKIMRGLSPARALLPAPVSGDGLALGELTFRPYAQARPRVRRRRRG